MPKIEIGKSIYLFQCSGGKQNKLAVYSHGETVYLNRKFRRPAGVTSNVYFYCPHGRVLYVAAERILKGQKQRYRCYTPATQNGHVPDYVLAKSQGWHTAGHSFTTLATVDTALMWTWCLGDPNKCARIDSDTTVSQLEGWIDRNGAQIQFDVATIRNRMGHASELRLSDVIRKLNNHGYAYGEVHCIFCRGSGTPYTPPDITVNDQPVAQGETI
jgi:hypothetical protein